MNSPSHLFVYGTLQPGDVRWPFLEPFVADTGAPDAVAGALFDTGVGYPAAVFDGSGRIVGRTYELRSDAIGEALTALDTEESSVAGGFHRVEVTTERGVLAWAYQYGHGLELRPIVDGGWIARQRATRPAPTTE